MAATEGSGVDVSSLPNIGGKQVSETGAPPSVSPAEPGSDEAAAAAAAAAVFAVSSFAGEPGSGSSGVASSGNSSRRTSRVWLYFNMIDNYHYACKLCRFVGTYTNTTNMRKHIQHHHPESYQDILDHTRHVSRPSLQPYCLMENQQQQLSLGQSGSDQLIQYRSSDRSGGTSNYPNYLHMQPPIPFSTSMSFDVPDKAPDVKPFVVGHSRFTSLHGTPTNQSGVSPPLHGGQLPPDAKRRFDEALPKKYDGASSSRPGVPRAFCPRSQALNVRSFSFNEQEYLNHPGGSDSFTGDSSVKYKHFTASHHSSKAKARVGSEIFESSKSQSPDGVVGGGAQRSMMQDDNGELSSGGGAVGLSGIEAVVAAAAAAAAAAGDSSTSSTGGTLASGDGQMMLGGGTVTSGAVSRDAQQGVGLSPPSITSPTKPESYQLRHNNHLSLVLNQLAEDEAFMDVTLTAEGRPVKAHKSVLSAVSPYFSSVLRANPCQHPIIIMPHDVSHAQLANIIMYIYKGEMTVSAEELPSLLKTAELLRITGLSPGENNSSHAPIGRASVTASSFAGLFNGSGNPPAAPTYTSASEAARLASPPARSDNPPQGAKKANTGAPAKTLPVRMESPPPEPTMLNPSDFMDLDMTCVKEEMNSDCEEEEDAPKSPTPKEVTTPPPVENPLSSDSRDRLHSDQRTDPDDSDSARPNLEVASDDADPPHRPATSLQSNASPSGHCDDSDTDIKRNSLKTLANLASLDTPTNLSPCDDSSSSSSVDPSDVQPNVCPYCSEYIAGGEVSSHMSTKHAFKPAFICSGCQRVFTRKTTHELHAKDCKKET